MHSVVKVDDTPVGIVAGHNAGCWTVGVTRSGNQVGLSQTEVEALSTDELRQKLDSAASVFESVNAHYTIESVADLPQVLDDIQTRLTAGERP